MIWWMNYLLNMSIPIGWLGVAYLFIKKTPNQINDLYGYRTKRSKKSDETWQFAHRYYGKIWLFLSPVLMVLITTVFLLIINESDYVIFISSIIITFILITVTSLSIIPVEKALKSHFDSSGVRIK